MRQVQLVVEPDDGTAPTLNAIRHAKKTIDLTIFRFDRDDVASALEAAVLRGVQVRALIAMSNGSGVHQLRRLESRLLEAGANVARSNKDFTRYHAKLMIVDGRTMHVNGFNYTAADLESRSFGIITTNKRTVKQATSLFEGDFAHRPYSGTDGLVVSPENARDRLESFIHGAHRELLIYDAKLGDPRILRLLAEKVRAGVAIRIIGHVGKNGSGSNGDASKPRVDKDGRRARGRRPERPAALGLTRGPGRRLQRLHAHRMSRADKERIGDARYVAGMHVAELRHRRMHLRAIIRDGKVAFVGSQSLRTAELDARREVGLFVHEADVVREIRNTFERDWPSDDDGLVVSVDHLHLLP